MDDHTDTNHSIVIKFEAEDLLLEVWKEISGKYNDNYSDKGHNGHVIQCSENGLKVTLTLYKPALKLHIQGDGCGPWKTNAFEKIVSKINVEGEIMNISETVPKFLLDNISLSSTPQMPQLSPMNKYLQRAANCKSKQMQSLEDELAEAHSSLSKHSDEVNTMQEQLAQYQHTVQCLTSTIEQQSRLFDKLLAEGVVVTKDLKSIALERDRLKNDCNKYKTDLVKVNTETFFMEDQIKLLQENIVKYGKEKNKLLDEMVKQNITVESINAKLDAFENRFDQLESISSNQNPSPSNNFVLSQTRTSFSNDCCDDDITDTDAKFDQHQSKSYASVLKSAKPSSATSEKVVKRGSVPQNKENFTDLPKSKEKKVDVDHSSNILLIGSSIFKYINRRGLERNVHVSTNRGAHVKDLYHKLRDKSLNMYKSVMIYCGGNDASSGQSTDEFYQQYSALLDFIRDKYPDIEVILCGLMPRRDVDVTLFNEVIYELCCDYNYQFVDNYESVLSGNGNIMRHMFNGDGIHLSHKGTASMLKNMNKYIAIFKTRYVHSQKNESFTENKCFKCSETGHSSTNCKHQSVLRCWSCGKSGHKIKHCGSW